MNLIKEISVFGCITVSLIFLINFFIANYCSATIDLWIYDSLASFIISIILLIISKIYKNKNWFDSIVRYFFANFFVFTFYNFIYSLKIRFGFVRFCINENISAEQLYKDVFSTNFLVFVTTLSFLLLFKSRNISVFTQRSVIYIILVLILTVFFKAQNLIFLITGLFPSIF